METKDKSSSYWEDYDMAKYEQYEQEWKEYFDRLAEEEAAEETRRNWEEARMKRNGEILIDVSGDDLSLDLTLQ